MQPNRHLWDYQWFRDLVFILLFLILIYIAYTLRAVLLPVIMALALAYAFHPLISWLQDKARIPRWLSTTGLLAIVLACTLSLMLWLTPQLINQTRNLIDKLPGYTDFATQKIRDVQDWAQMEDDRAQGDSDDDVVTVVVSTSQPATTQPGDTTQPASTQPAQPAVVVQITTSDGDKSKKDKSSGEQASTTQPAGGDESQAKAESPAATDPTTPVDTTDDPETAATSPAPTTQGATTHTVTTQSSSRQAKLTNALGSMDVSTLSSMLVQTFNVGLGVVGLTISIGTYLVLAAALLMLGFFFFSWKFDSILAWCDTFIPDRRRERVMHVVRRMDQAISAFVRGRLVQVAILTCVLCAGWAWVGVPYWLLLGVLGGVLNIVPYAAVISWPLAVLLMWFDTASGNSSAEFSFMHVFFWPSLVYCVGQILDGWVVEPLVQGKATNLDPFTVLVAVIVGGSLLGIMGTIIAVPVTACIKILMEEVILPHIRRLIHSQPPPTEG